MSLSLLPSVWHKLGRERVGAQGAVLSSKCWFFSSKFCFCFLVVIVTETQFELVILPPVPEREHLNSYKQTAERAWTWLA